MKKEYDFSTGERGKFYRPNAQFNLPIYLEPEVERFVEKLAEERKSDRSLIVNALLKREKEMLESS